MSARRRPLSPSPPSPGQGPPLYSKRRQRGDRHRTCPHEAILGKPGLSLIGEKNLQYLGYLGTLITEADTLGRTHNYNEVAYLPDLTCAVFTALVRHASCREHSNSVLPRGNGASGEKSDFTINAISRLISESRLCFTRAFVDRQNFFLGRGRITPLIWIL